MSQEIKLIRSAIPGKRPDRYNINVGEFALNTADGIFYFKRGDDTVQSLFSTNTVIEGNLLLKGNTFLTGSTQVFGSFFTIGPSSFSGSVGISSSLNVRGTSSLTGSFNVTGSTNVIGTSSFTGSVEVSSSFKVIGTSSFTGSINATGSFNVVGISSFTGSVGISSSLNVLGTSSFTGSFNVTGSIKVTGSQTISVLPNINSGSTLFDIQGSQGQLFSVTDSLNGVLMSVNDISGLPILEVSSDDKVVMGTFGSPGLTISGSNVKIGNKTSDIHTLTGSFSITGSTNVIGTSSFTGFVGISSSLNVRGTSSLTGSFNVTGSVNVTGSQVNSGSLRVTDQIYHPVSHHLNTGILSGGIISGSIGGTTVTIGSGSGQITSASFIPNDGVEITYKNINWSSFSNITPDYLNTQPFTYFYIDGNGNLQQQPTNFTDQQLRENIILGHVCHINLTNINLITNAQDVAYGTGFRLEELLRVFGPLKKSGLTIEPSGSSMRVSRASGQVFLIGTNYENDALYPDVKTLNAVTASNVCFIYRSGSSFVFDNNNGNFYTSVTSSKYDLRNGTLGNVNNNQWTIQRLFMFPNNPNDIVFYLGTVIYNSFSDATAGLNSEQFTEASITSENAVYLGALLSRGGATDLSNTSNAVFFQSGIFRGTGGGGGGGGGAGSLDDLTDVTITSVSTGDLLVYTGGGWENRKQLNGNYQVTGSLNVSGSIITSGSVNIVGDLSVTGEIINSPDSTSISNGATTSIKTIAGAGIEAAFFDYVIKTNDGNHKRAGGAIIMWKVADSLVEFTEYSTLDIGNTSNIIIGATISGTDVNVNVTNNSGQIITVKSTVRLL
jgi:hypothetical protein